MTPGAAGEFLAIQLFGCLFVLIGAWGGKAIVRRMFRVSALEPRHEALSFAFGAVAGVIMLALAYADESGEPNWWIGAASALPLAFVGGFVSARRAKVAA